MKLWELAKLVRSKNASPFTIAIDIMFDDKEKYNLVKQSKAINNKKIAEIYQLDHEKVLLVEVDNALAIKISFPRKAFSGDINDTDVYGGQFYSPLVELDISDKIKV
jgi:hypothetical protein